MKSAAQAIRAEIAETKRNLLRLERALEVVTGKRGIEGAPATSGGRVVDKVSDIDEEQKEDKKKEKKNVRKPGQLIKEITNLLSDGKERTTKEIALALDSSVETVSTSLRRVDNIQKRKGKAANGRRSSYYRLELRENVIVPGDGVHSGRLKERSWQ